MRTFRLIAPFMVLVLVLAACGNGDEGEGTDATDGGETADVEDEV